MANSENKKIDVFLIPDTFSTLKTLDSNDGIINVQKCDNLPTKNKECKSIKKQENFDIEKSADNGNLKSGGKKTVNKSLLGFRLALFLWAGAGVLCLIFLVIFLKQRGLTLVELSTVFLIVIIFQFLTSFITGIITDKIGDPKPVLIILILSCPASLIAMLVIPNINSKVCTQLNNDTTYNNTTQSFISCYKSCLYKENKILQTGETYPENSSLVEEINSVIDDKNICDFSERLTNNSFDLSIFHCCDVCTSSGKIICTEVRQGYLVVTYAILILVFYSARNAAISFLDFIAMSLCVKNDSHLGKERIFPTGGMFFMTVIVAFVLNIDKSSRSNINYDPVVWLAAGLQFCTFLSIYLIKIPILPPGKQLMKNAFGLLKDVDQLTFILLVFMAGVGFGFYFALHLVFLEAIDTPNIVVSLHSVVIIFCGFPVLFTSEWWMRKFGTQALMVLSLLSYVLKHVAYSYITNTWWSLLIDLNVAFSFHLFWVVQVVHSIHVAPVGFAATLNALTGAMHNGIGRGAGVFFGGMLMNYMGPRESYRVMAAVFLLSAILYCIYLFIRRKSLKNINFYGKNTTDTKHSKEKEVSDVTITEVKL